MTSQRNSISTRRKGLVLMIIMTLKEVVSLTYGFAIERVHELRWNPKTKRKEPFKLRDDPVYFYRWNKKEVQQLLDGSTTPCPNLYIGVA
jgi:hypothetical protein